MSGGPGSRSMTRGFVGRCVPRAKLRTRWTWLTSRPTDGRLTAFLIDDRYRTLRRHAYPILDLHLRCSPSHESTLRSAKRRNAGRFVRRISHLLPLPPLFRFSLFSSLHEFEACFPTRINAPFRESNRGFSGSGKRVAKHLSWVYWETIAVRESFVKLLEKGENLCGRLPTLSFLTKLYKVFMYSVTQYSIGLATKWLRICQYHTMTKSAIA